MHNGDLKTIAQIKEMISYLEPTTEGIVELVYLVKKAVEITKVNEPNNNARIKMLNALINQELSILIDPESDQEMLEQRFNEAVSAFKLDLNYGPKTS